MEYKRESFEGKWTISREVLGEMEYKQGSLDGNAEYAGKFCRKGAEKRDFKSIFSSPIGPLIYLRLRDISRSLALLLLFSSLNSPKYSERNSTSLLGLTVKRLKNYIIPKIISLSVTVFILAFLAFQHCSMGRFFFAD
jgi:hypothetical protein